MSDRQLPPNPNLPQYRKQAKDLLKAANSGDPQAIARLVAAHSRQIGTSPGRFTLANAQHALAREYGFPGWPQFQREIEAMSPENQRLAIWKLAEKAVIAGDQTQLESLLAAHGEMLLKETPPASGPGNLRPDYSAGEARAILFRNHEFDSWSDFEKFQSAASSSGSPVAQFELAADCIAKGDISRLTRILQLDGSLIKRRSERKHHSTLLHYIGANGIEYWRQRTPRNAIEICRLLLDSGAEVDAPADMYGSGSTTLGLVATSVHPDRARLQAPIMELLVSRGAAITGDENAVNGCLSNGRQQAAEWLAGRGAELDIEGAAGVGNIEVVASYFDAHGNLNESVTEEKLLRAFAWACEYGRTTVVEYLLDHGVPVNASIRNHGQTGLHWAAHCAHLETAKLLLKRGSPIDSKDPSYNGTPLDWAIHGWSDPPPGTPHHRYHAIVKLLVSSGAQVEPSMLQREAVRSDPKMLAALQGDS